jgi:alcohol dehydrogenase class IV
MANLACGNAELGLVHALTSAPSVKLAHGYQNGVLLPHVAEYNLALLSEAAADEVAQLPALMARVGFEPRFAPGEIGEAGADAMVAAALANPFIHNNCRPAGEGDLRALLVAAGAGEGDT